MIRSTSRLPRSMRAWVCLVAMLFFGELPPRIIELVKTRIPRRFGLDPYAISGAVSDEPGWCRRQMVNIELQAALNPTRDRKVERFG